MMNIILSIAAILVATSAALAGSDHYGSENANKSLVPVATRIDHGFTASIGKPTERHIAKSISAGFQPEPGQGIWGQ